MVKEDPTEQTKNRDNIRSKKKGGMEVMKIMLCKGRGTTIDQLFIENESSDSPERRTEEQG